jgi:hypothetical protein
MGVESRYGIANPYEASPEDLNASETTHQDPFAGQIDDQYHQATDGADAMSASDAGQARDNPASDPMDGAEDAPHQSEGEQIDDAERGSSIG